MRVLITGGAGFIGSHLAESLIDSGHEVVVLDDLSTGNLANVRKLEHYSRFQVIVNSIFNQAVLTKLVNQCDVIVHLAAAVGVRLVVDQPVRTIETNVRGTEAVLAAAAERRRKILIASTSEVYGLSTQIPFREDSPLAIGAPSSIRWGYACSKAMDEFLAMSYHQEFGLPVIITRFFNTVGPRQSSRYGMVLPTFIKQALADEPITIYGTGDQTRCFCDVSDVVTALKALLQHPDSVGEVFNIGTPDEISIRDLAELVKETCHSQSEIVTIPYVDAYPAGYADMPRRVPDLTKINHLIGYQPTISLQETIRRIIVDHRTSFRCRTRTALVSA
jgi:UDP-glucose 4-epimerase